MGPTNMPDLRTRLTLDISDFTRGLTSARAQASLFGGEISNVTSAFTTAGIAMATFATISLFTAGIVATAFMGSIAVLMTLGVVGAAQAQQVKDAWTQTGKVISQGMLEASRAYVPVLQRLAVGVSAAFTQVQPALTQVFDRLAPLFEDLSNEFIGWLTGLINEMPDMVNRTIGFFASISGAWDQATDNMRAGWHEVVVSVLQFGPTLLNEGLPPFGEFVGRVLALLAPVVQISSTFAGPLFTSLAMVADAAGGLLTDVLGQAGPQLVALATTLGDIGLGLASMLSGIGGPISGLLSELVVLGGILSTTFVGLGPTLTGLLQSASDTGAALLPVFAAIGRFLVGLGPAAVAFAQMIGQMISAFVQGISPLLAALGPDWSSQLVTGIHLITPAMVALAGAAGQFVTFLVQGSGAVISAVGAIANGLGFLAQIFHDTGFNAGQALVIGIIAGLGLMISPMVGVVAGLVAAVAAYLPRSPAEVGPLSGDGSPDQRGLKLGSMFADGIAASTDLVQAAAQDLVSAVGLPNANGTSSANAAAIQPVYTVTPPSTGDTTIINVEGSVITENDLMDLIQTYSLRKESRNAGSTLATSVRGNTSSVGVLP